MAGMVELWLDENWERGAAINRAIGEAAAASYEARWCEVSSGASTSEEAFGGLVLAMAEDLLGFDFSDSFVSAFEVANKVIEMLMLREGVDVCCVSEEDLTRADRYEALTRASGG